jgi:hypothetical protein
MSEAARSLGRKGGFARARKLNATQRRTSALRAINGRWRRQETDTLILLRELATEYVRNLSHVKGKK